MISPSELVLLTGAGFTKTFGGYLASEMWARIFNQPGIQRYPTLRETMLTDLNFESVYSAVVESRRYTPADKRSFTEALRNAYKAMHDKILSERVDLVINAVAGCKAIISQFIGSEDTKGFFFTLNQDQFVERWFEDVIRTVILMPGIKPGIRWFYPANGPWIESIVELPDKSEVRQIRASLKDESAKLVYVKLHGSYGWRSKIRGAGRQDLMVIGRAKSDLIKKEPLLRWYFRIFETVLSSAKILVVIGYGFGDEHINRVMAENRGLAVSVICPAEPKHFKANLMSQRFGRKIWKKLMSYYQGDITQLYDRTTQELTPEGQNYFGTLNEYRKIRVS